MFNFCIFTFILFAVGGSAKAILFGGRRKETRFERGCAARQRQAARRRRSAYEKKRAAVHRRAYAPKIGLQQVQTKTARGFCSRAVAFCP